MQLQYCPEYSPPTTPDQPRPGSIVIPGLHVDSVTMVIMRDSHCDVSKILMRLELLGATDANFKLEAGESGN